MATVTSNYQQVARAVFGLSRALSPRRRVSSGHYLAEIYNETIAGAVERRTADEQKGPEGKPLPRLSPRYKARKVRQGFDPRVLVRTGEMLSPAELRGRLTFGESYLVMAAGVGAEVQQKVAWASKGNPARNRPARRFYELGRDGERAVDGACREALASAVIDARLL